MSMSGYDPSYGGSQIATLRLPDGREVAFVDWQDQPLFSTADLLSGWTDETVSFFTYVQGDSVSGTTNLSARRTATSRDTNAATPGSLAGTEELLVYSIRPEAFQAEVESVSLPNPDDQILTQTGDPLISANKLALLGWLCNLRLTVSQKTMHECPFGYYNTGFGATAIGGAYPGTPLTVGRTIGSQGLPSNEAVRSFAIPVHIGGTEKYRVDLVNPTSAAIDWLTETEEPAPSDATLVTMRVYLDGLYKRPVA